ncbi:carbohydrate kinase family protein [Cohnella suwonensis]|uniref:Carbohydrate kinase family protein n=1 Tax=Cohnella suwonensis TaxID=696072 RepID=A0ABW0LUM7_9BACL
MKIFDAVVIGDANIDLVVPGQSQVPEPGQEVLVDNIAMHVGGGAALFAISLAKLGTRVAFNGVLGDDSHGRYIRDRFAEYGIDTRMVRTSREHNTGISIAFNPGSDRSFITYWGSNMELRFDNLDIGQISQGAHVHLTGYKGKRNHDPYLNLVKTLKDNGVTLSCDVGWDDSGEWDRGVFELMPYVDVFLMNETECFHYTGMENVEESLKYMSDYGGHVVVKLGKNGAIAVKNGILYRVPGYSVEAVDTTGAGDSFNAGYLFGFLSGKNVETSMRYGNACGALSVSAYGGSTNTPTFEQLERFIDGHRQMNQPVQS